MADYYTHLSFAVSVPREAADYAIELAHYVDEMAFGEMDDSFRPIEGTPAFDAAAIIEEDGENPTGCSWSISDDVGLLPAAADAKTVELWVHDDGCASPHTVASIIQAMLKKFGIDGAVVIDWSSDCSKPRLDAYGGGCIIVTKDAVHSMCTYDWAEQQLKHLGLSVIPQRPAETAHLPEGADL